MFQLIGYLAGFINIFGFVPYIRDIFGGTTKPQRMSWFIWLVLGSIAFASQFAEGAHASLWMTGVQTSGVVVIFLISLSRGVGGFTRSDLIALAVAALGLVLWYFTKQAVWALYLVILVDIAGVALTVHKSYLNPESESLVAWWFYAIAGLLAAVAVGRFNVILLSYPIYIFLANFTVVIAISLGNKRKARVS
jgi:hypothetical protein